jgi:spiro-SPASM protein
MSVEDFRKLLDSIRGFSGDGVVSVSLWGEPAYHGAFADLCVAVSERPGLDLIVETSGVGWHESVLHRIAEDCERPPRWIVSLDALDPTLYAQLRGDGHGEALSTIDTLLGLFPDRVHVQAVRMQSNELDLEEFYRTWKKRIGGNVIIQKYDHFCGSLPGLKVTDLSPLQRMPCWHLRRDLYVLLDGTVPMCREDLAGSHKLGNALEEPLDDIWQRGESYFRRHLDEEYPELCRNCDEYYTYNF